MIVPMGTPRKSAASRYGHVLDADEKQRLTLLARQGVDRSLHVAQVQPGHRAGLAEVPDDGVLVDSRPLPLCPACRKPSIQ